jgi:hypothetical protein
MNLADVIVVEFMVKDLVEVMMVDLVRRTVALDLVEVIVMNFVHFDSSF